MGEVLFFSIYVAQQLGVMLGVGAQTVLLCTHLLALHRGTEESPQSNHAVAARKSLSVGFFLIVFSGLGAVAVEIFGGHADILFAPAFLFKWVLILLLLSVFWFSNRLSQWSDIVAWFAGGTWFALFLVHSLAPITSWFNLGVLYFLWLLCFGILWTAFVFLMRKTARPVSPAKVAAQKFSGLPSSGRPPAGQTFAQRPPPPLPVIPPAPVVIKPAPVVPAAPIPPPVAPVPPPPPPKPIPPPLVPTPPPAPKPMPPPPIVVVAAPVVPPAPAKPSVFKRLLLWIESLSAHKPHEPVAPVVVPPPVVATPKPVPPPVPKPIPPPPVPITTPPAPKLELSPTVHPLSLPVPPPVAPVPPPPPKPPVAVPPKAPEPQKEKQGILHDVIDHLLVPALRIMPKSAEDIGKQNRPPVVKLSDE